MPKIWEQELIPHRAVRAEVLRFTTCGPGNPAGVPFHHHHEEASGGSNADQDGE